MTTSDTTQAQAEMARPRPEHQWLQNLVGEWTYETTATMEPGQPPTKFGGSESVRSLGGLWTVAEGQGEMPGGGSMTSIMTLGYDAQSKRYVGTWIGSVMPYLWVYDGALDSSGKVLTLSADGPDMSVEGKMANYQDVIEFKDDNHRVLTSRTLGEDGTWNEFMRVDYRRKA
jgi:Protein of unknown function (DUF1579)